MKLTRKFFTRCWLLIAMLAAASQVAAQTYTYDKIGRLTNVTYPSGASIAYSYDANSNITRITHTGVAALLPPDGVIDTPDGDVTIEPGQSVDFTGTGADPDGALPLAYRWDFDGGAPDSTDEDPGPTTFDAEGAYTVRFFVTDATGIADPTPGSVVVTVRAASSPPADPPPAGRQPSDSSGGGAVFWLPLFLLLTRLRRSLAPLALLLAALSANAAQWQPMNSPTTDQLNDVWGASADAVYAVGDNGTVLFFDGETWSPLDLGVTAKLNAVWGRSADDVYIAGGPDTLLHFDGQSWTTIDIGETGFNFVDVWSAGPGEPLWLVATRGAWYFDGTTWTRQGFTDYLTRSLSPNAVLTAIGGTPDYTVVTGMPLTSTFFGFYVNFDDTADFRTKGIIAFSDTEMYAVGEYNRRLNGGNAELARDWQNINITSGARDVWGSSPNDVFVVGTIYRFQDTGGIYHYDGNPDNTWEQVYTLQSTALNSVFGFGPNDVFVVGERGTILRYFEPPPPATAANFPYSGMMSPNVNAHTGELILVERDFSLGHLMPVTFERYYASGLINDTRAGGQLGRNWTHNYEWKLVKGERDGVPEVTIITPRGRTIKFRNPAGDWELIEPLSTPFLLVETDGDYRFADPGTEHVFRFDKRLDRLVSIEDRNGNRIRLNYNTGVLISVDDAKGNEVVFEYADVNRLGGVYTLGASTSPEPRYDVRFEYTNGNLTSVTDPGGRMTTYEYDVDRETDALIEAVHLPLTTEKRWAYDDRKRVIAEQLTEGGEFTFTYNELSTVATNPDATSRSYSHDGAGALTRFEDEMNRVRSYEYDPDGRPRKFIDRIGREYTWTYHGGSFKLETAKRPDQLGYTLAYEQNGSAAGVPFYDVVRVDYPDGTAVTMDYDAFGNMTTFIDQESNIWTFTHNAEGQVETATNPLSGVTRYQYWSHGALQDVQDHNDNFTRRLLYDGYRRLSAIEFADRSRRSFVWNSRGDLEKLTTELGEVYDYGYDEDGRLGKVTSSSGEVVEYAYNGRGDLESATRPGEDGSGIVSTLSYDAFGRVASLTDPESVSVGVGYDAIGRVNELVDGLGQSWKIGRGAEGTLGHVDFPGEDVIEFDNTDNALRLNTRVSMGNERLTLGHDPMGRVINVADALENTSTISRDGLGGVTGVARPEPGVKTAWERNGLGQVTKQIDPLGGEWEAVRDAQGRVINTIDPLDRLTTIRYDEGSRPQRITFPEGAGEVTLVHNAADQAERAEFSDGTVLELDHDTQGRPRSGTNLALDFDTRGNLSDSNGISIRYDNNDRIKRIEMAPGRHVEYFYDARGKLERMVDWLGGETTFGRTERGRVASIELPNGVANGYEYDRAGRVIGITYGTIGSIAIERDWRGLPTSANRNLPGPQTIASDVRAYDFDAASQVMRFGYDPVGNLREADGRRYEFNLASQLTGYDSDSGRVTLTYDVLGKPVTRTRAGSVRAYTWNYGFGRERVSVEKEAGQDLWYYVYTTSGRLLYRINGDGVRHHYHFDENGNTVFITDNEGKVIQTYFYSPLGEVLDSSGNVDNDRKAWAEVGGLQMDESEINYLEGELFDSVNGIGLAPVRPAEFRVFDYGSFAPPVPRRGSSADKMDEDMQKFMRYGRDHSLNSLSLLSPIVLKYLPEAAGGQGRLVRLVTQGTRFGVKALGPAATLVGAPFAGIEEHRGGHYQSTGADLIATGGTTGLTAAVGLTPPGAVAMFVITGVDIVSEAVFGTATGAADALLLNTPRAAATLYEATFGGRGWKAVEAMSDRVKTQGPVGAYIAGEAESWTGEVWGSLFNLVSGETYRTWKLEREIREARQGRP